MINVMQAPERWIFYVDYGTRTDGQPIFQGYARPGVNVSSAGWVIFSFSYDTSNNLTSKLISSTSWINRATASYV